MAAERLPAALIDDLVIEILLRLPPDDTACLARASLVCKTWRRILSDRAFFRRYREIHGAPPVMGFLYNNCDAGSTQLFIHTTPASPSSQRTSAGIPAGYRILNCRHGRILLNHTVFTTSFVVWDPIHGQERCITTREVPLKAAVLCASKGCDHLDCSNGPYHVVLLARDRHFGVDLAQTRVLHYYSEMGMWSVSAIKAPYIYTGLTPSLLTGDALFFLAESSGRVLKYDLTCGFLSEIEVPIHHVENMILCTADDGGLGYAAVEGCSLRLMFSRTNPDGVTEWCQARAIKLDSMISSGIGDHLTKFHVVGFAEGTSYIFIQANDSIFSVELKSGRISKIGSGKFGTIFPFMGFYIPDLASARLQVPLRIE